MAMHQLTFTEVTSLNHEVFYNSMEQASFVVQGFLGSFPNASLTWMKAHRVIKITSKGKAFYSVVIWGTMVFTCAEAPEVLASFGTDIWEELYHNPANFEMEKRRLLICNNCFW